MLFRKLSYHLLLINTFHQSGLNSQLNVHMFILNEIFWRGELRMSKYYIFVYIKYLIDFLVLTQS